MAERYLRISALGLPPALIALAGQGYLRGIGDLRTPLLIVVAAQLANVVLELWFVYGLDLGLGRLRGRDGHRAARHGRGLRLAAAAHAATACGNRLRRPGPCGWRRPRGVRLRPPPPPTLAAGAAAAHLRRALRALRRSARGVRDGERRDRADRRELARRASDRDGPLHLRRARARRDRDRGAGARRARARSGRRERGARRGLALARLVARRRLPVRCGAARARQRAAAGLHRRPRGDRARPRDLDAARAHAAGGGGCLRSRRDPHRRRRHALPGGLDAARRLASTSRSRCSRSRWTGASPASGRGCWRSSGCD